jgi:type II secretory pathway component PulM
MTRRAVAFLGIVLLLVLAMTLLWQVYEHHREADPYERDEPATVRLDVMKESAVNFAGVLR